MSTRSIGLMGGTFDPIHHAHLIVAEEVRYALNLTEMVFIPAGEPPHKVGRITAPVQDRVAMVELAVASNPHFSVSRVEVDRPGPSYLVDTLRLLKKQWGKDTELFFVIGWDSLEDFPTWYKPTEILEQLTRLVVVHRPGYKEDEEYNQQLEARLPGLLQKMCPVAVPQLDISSTDLRQRIVENRPIKYQTPAEVEAYIQEHQLYRYHTES
ncbi:nicotinate-nucleotide adenylyltransferase [Dictyobacter formicarum]|uniref:Probable nicotinate-nucleotide adenylyltransferase n=1 Tax=Dictyobacter formicarum TaxID=2778368 RepID=A0ABQ3VG13_9CHLR|nr:nicotinate-nucleotide adenylyltransferase [Dictyobacter formicarum]GHO84654.1 putative nicotinate-nucleotide adenylyltransferase [Dictyobacter formicarum]